MLLLLLAVVVVVVVVVVRSSPQARAGDVCLSVDQLERWASARIRVRYVGLCWAVQAGRRAWDVGARE